MVTEQMLLKPKLGQSCRGQGFVTAYRHKTSDIVRSDASPVNLISVCVEAKTLPKPCLMQIAQQISPKHTIVGLSPLDPPGVAKSLAKIKATDGEARISKRLAQMVHINWRNYSAGNTGVAAAVGISSERGLSKQ